MSAPSCLTCSNCLRQDYGYSNWTVEGSTVTCMLRVHPELNGLDVGYEEQPLLDFAKDCDRYREGTPAWLDVDSEQMIYDPETGQYSYKEDCTYFDDSNRDVFFAWLVSKDLRNE